jgi:hypothetical protein
MMTAIHSLRKHIGTWPTIKRWWRSLLPAIALGFTATASAQLLDSIDTRIDQGVTEIRLQFSVPVQYLKHFPVDQGELVKLYLQSAGLEDTEPLRLTEFKRVRTTSDTLPFRVLYTTARNCFAVANPICLDIQFSHPVHFRIRPGTDGRSILFVVLPEAENPAPAKPKR